jgi:ribosome biogenesis protein Nip4
MSDIIHIKEHLIYINGFLTSIGILNLAPNSGKNYGFVELDSISDNLTECLRNFLETPKWHFKFVKLNEDWKKIIIKESDWAFTEIITQNYGYPVEIGFEKYETLTKKYNLKIVQEFIFDVIERFLKSFNGFEVYQVEILQSDDNSGYFAHGESNYLFKTTENKLFLLYFRASD